MVDQETGLGQRVWIQEGLKFHLFESIDGGSEFAKIYIVEIIPPVEMVMRSSPGALERPKRV